MTLVYLADFFGCVLNIYIAYFQLFQLHKRSNVRNYQIAIYIVYILGLSLCFESHKMVVRNENKLYCHCSAHCTIAEHILKSLLQARQASDVLQCSSANLKITTIPKWKKISAQTQAKTQKKGCCLMK